VPPPNDAPEEALTARALAALFRGREDEMQTTALRLATDAWLKRFDIEVIQPLKREAAQEEVPAQARRLKKRIRELQDAVKPLARTTGSGRSDSAA
jgi:hypothetical protein